MIDYILVLLIMGFLWVLAATIFDIKTKEVPNWLNFTLIVIALACRLLYSIITNDYWIILGGLIGLVAFIIIANILYYAKAFGGGDAKLLIALGTIIWLSKDWKTATTYSTLFIITLLIVGFLYGITMSLIILMGSKKEGKKRFMEETKKQARKNKVILTITSVMIIISGITSTYYKSIEMMILTIALIILPLLLVYSKATEKTLLIKKISTKELRVGDWLYKNIKLGKGKIIESRFDGVTEEEIKKIKRSLNYVTIRDGIPFVPAFLITYIIFAILWYSGSSLITNILNLI